MVCGVLDLADWTGKHALCCTVDQVIDVSVHCLAGGAGGLRDIGTRLTSRIAELAEVGEGNKVANLASRTGQHTFRIGVHQIIAP